MTPTRRQILLAALTLGPALQIPRAAIAETRILSGTVTYRERRALPPGATVTVQIEDVSRADARAQVIGETSLAADGSVPFAYRISYDPADILPGHSYAMRAQITLGERLLFINTTRHSVFADGPDMTDILVEQVARPRATPAPTGQWLAEDILGGGVIDNARTVLEIADDGAVGGSGGCNRFSGTATISGDTIRFAQLAATTRACIPALMEQEQRFFRALDAARGWRIDAERDKLVLLDKDGQTLILLARD
ncbi:YbaY family lipoprotein [Paracoccus marinaquae]|uniref:YbaY family lipoprotein n=1 Tax=Paracoccus marinaquae TaxID=2841926 RepID=A0ABS6AN40_9RHOB|nr:YbaY family lipoprotein [Paracoccus marinaquae]MBU3032012.1 YbaY family lipoprotein [Paracoccus marinaquae]